MRKAVVVSMVAAIVSGVNAEFKKPREPKHVPELLVTFAGEKVDSVRKWEDVRRKELFKTFMEEEYGVRPVERPADLRFEEIAAPEWCYGGKALRKRVKGMYSGPGGFCRCSRTGRVVV